MKIPKNWNEVTIKQFKKLDAIQRGDSEEKNIELLGALCNMNEKELYDLDMSQLTELNTKTSWAIHLPPTKLIEKFTLNGRQFRVEHRANKISVGQYIDLKNYLKNANSNQNMDKILTCFIFEDGKDYDTNNIEELSELFNDYLTIDIAYPLVVFFCNLLVPLTETIQHYMEKKVQQQMKIVMREKEKVEKLLAKDGDGSRPLKPLQKLRKLISMK